MGANRLLICTNHMQDLGGSEIVTLELVEFFVDAGWSVVLYTNIFAEPMRSEAAGALKSGRLTVVTDATQTHRLDGDFDLMWVNHSLVPQIIVERFSKEGFITPIIWHHMSSVLPLELPIHADVEEELASVITVISGTARERIEGYGLPLEKISLFENPAPDIFGLFSSAGPGSILRKIVVISNHPPAELVAAMEPLRVRGVVVESVGLGRNYRRITPEFLDQFDAVVTIGKTTQYALSMGKPVYSYDHFGGGGWLIDENMDFEAHGNFAGRIVRRKLSSWDIVEEIISGYDQAAAYAWNSRFENAAKWSLSRMMKNLLSDSRLTPAQRKISPVRALAFGAELEYRSQLTRLNHNLEANLRAVQEDSQGMEASLNHLKGSISWKITMPLRFVLRLLSRSRIRLRKVPPRGFEPPTYGTGNQRSIP
jgi:hypothetical protein